VWVQGGVHGNEPAGDMATLALLGKLEAEPEWREMILEKLDILVLPRYNPDGEFCKYCRTGCESCERRLTKSGRLSENISYQL
jgi:murein tripeptide amidase MpaA